MDNKTKPLRSCYNWKTTSSTSTKIKSSITGVRKWISMITGSIVSSKGQIFKFTYHFFLNNFEYLENNKQKFTSLQITDWRPYLFTIACQIQWQRKLMQYNDLIGWYQMSNVICQSLNRNGNVGSFEISVNRVSFISIWKFKFIMLMHHVRRLFKNSWG